MKIIIIKGKEKIKLIINRLLNRKINKHSVKKVIANFII